MKHIDNLIKIAVAIISIVLAVIFIKGIFSGPINSLGVLDDYIMFYGQFEDYWLKANSFWSKLQYFILKSNWPHPKIIGRVITLICYYTFGYMHISYIVIYSNIMMICTCGVIYSLYFRNKSIFILPILLILLQVHQINFWAVAIIAHATVYMVILLFFYSLVNKRYVIASFLLFILFFRSGGGFLIMIPLSIILFLLYKQQKINLKSAFYFIGIGIFFFTLFYFITLEGVLTTNRTSTVLNNVDSISLSKKFSSIFIYTSQIIGGFSTSKYLPLTHNNYVNFSFGIIGIILSLTILYKSKSIPTRLYPVFGASFYFLLLCLLAGVVNDKPTLLFETTVVRYKFYSIFFWISIYILLMESYRHNNNSYLFFILICLLCSVGYYQNINSNYVKNLGFIKDKGLFNNVVGDLYSKPQLDRKILKNISINKLYNGLYERGAAGDFKFDRILSKKMDHSKIRISDPLNNNETVNYYTFENNGLLKINGFVRKKKKRLLAILTFDDAHKEYYLVNKFQKKGKNFFFDVYAIIDADEEYTVSFAQLKDKYYLMNSQLSFETNILKNGFSKTYNLANKSEIVQIEKKFYKVFLNNKRSTQHKISKAYRAKNRRLKKFKKSK